MPVRAKSVGGMAAQGGFLYQNAIAANHLLELLIGAEGVHRVTIESKSASVNDIVVERRSKPNLYYEVKRRTGRGPWNLQRLFTEKIIQSFYVQFLADRGNCELVLASPVPKSQIHRVSELARAAQSLESFESELTKVDREGWGRLEELCESKEVALNFLRCLDEAVFPEELDDLRDIFLGRYRERVDAKPDIWALLHKLATEGGAKGEPFDYLRLQTLLRDRSEYFRRTLPVGGDIQSLRGPAREWYVHREEEWELLSAYHNYSKGEAANLLVVGERGFGKSSFLRWAERELCRETTIPPVFVSMGAEDVQTFIDRLADRVSDIAEIYKNRHHFVSSLDRLMDLAVRVRDKELRIVIIVDQLESFFLSGDVRGARDRIARARNLLFDAIRATSPPSGGFLWLLATGPEYFFLLFPKGPDVQELSLTWLQLGELNADQSREFLDRLIDKGRMRFTPEAKTVFLEQTGRRPLNLILSFINTYRDFGYRMVQADELLQTRPWQGMFLHDFERLGDSEKDVVYVLAALIKETGRRIIGLNELTARMKLVGKISASELEDVLYSIQNTHYLLQQPQRHQYSFYHEDFADYVYSRSRLDPVLGPMEEGGRGLIQSLAEETRSSMTVIFSNVKVLKSLEAGEEGNGKARLLALQALSEEVRRFSARILAWEIASFEPDELHLSILRRPIDLGTLVMELSFSWQGPSVSRGLKFEYSGFDVSPSLVAGDHDLLSIAVASVVANAVQYAKSGSTVAIKISKSVGRVILEIEDVGIGLEPGEAERLFQKGVRGLQALQARPGGAGLGLYVAKRIVESHNGEIAISSSSMEGGTCKVAVRISLPGLDPT